MKHRFKNRVLSLVLSVCMMMPIMTQAMPVYSVDDEVETLGAFTTPFTDQTQITLPNNTTTTSKSYRIPSMVTLNDGTIVAAADIRWNTTYDGGGLDTLVARSTDGGANWDYTLANYLGDNGNAYDAQSTTFIDPSLLVVQEDGKEVVYMLVDLYAYGVALNGPWTNNGMVPLFSYPSPDTGFNTAGFLKLTNDGTNYNYYLDGGSIWEEGASEPVSGYIVDAKFNITNTDTGETSNLFFETSPYRVARTQFLYLTKSEDGGASWSEPTLLNLRSGDGVEDALLVAPGNAIVAKDGTMVFPAYSYDYAPSGSSMSSSNQYMTLIYAKKNQNGELEWHRSPMFQSVKASSRDSVPEFSSEGAIVELADGTLRVFFRNKTAHMCYADFDIDTGAWIGMKELLDVPTNSDTQLSAITYSKTLDGKQVILVSCPTGPKEAGSNNGNGGFRTNGKIHVFTVNADDEDEKNSMTLIDTVNLFTTPAQNELSGNYTEADGFFAYSSMTERTDGSVAILYENNQFGWGAGDNTYYTITGKAFSQMDLFGEETVLENIYMELFEAVCKEHYDEINASFADVLEQHPFSAEQQASLDEFYDSLPNEAEIVYTPWSGRIGPLMPAVKLISPYARRLRAASPAGVTDDSIVDNAAIHTSKRVVDNGNGTYTITIEAYTEGNVTVTTTKTPVDVVLVLDMSGSMTFGFGHTTREKAVEYAVQTFVKAIISDAITNNVDHRVSVITYDEDLDMKCGLTNVLTDAQTVRNKVSDNSLKTGHGTRSDRGLEGAVNVFAEDTPGSITNTTRQRAVIFFTDGSPTGPNSNTFDGGVAEDAINYAHTLKNTYGATVYSVAVLDGANPAATPVWSGRQSNTLRNGFLHAVSSNYPDATAEYSNKWLTITPGEGGNNDYYLTAKDPDDLNNIFDTMSSTIISGSTSVNLGTETVVKDIVTPYFVIPNGTSGVEVQVSDCTGYTNGTFQWGTPYDLVLEQGRLPATVTGNTLDVSGFDFKHNYVAQVGRKENESSANANFYGRKLIISFNIVPHPQFLGGDDVPTNDDASGIYSGDGTLYENLIPVPEHVDVPLKQIKNVVQDKHIYYSNSTNLTELLNLHVTDLSTDMDLQDLANRVNNAYVDLVYDIKVGGNTVATYTIEAGDLWNEGTWIEVGDSDYLEEMQILNDTEFSVSCTMISINKRSNTSSTDKAGSAKVYVYKPALTFKDSEVYYGDSVVLGDHLVPKSEVWTHANKGNSTANPMEGTKPTLDISYSYADNAIVNGDAGVRGNVNVTEDIPVNVTVKVGTQDITKVVTFVHSSCSHPGCGYKISDEEFIIHVLLRKTSLTITKRFPDGADYAIDVNQSFLFHVNGTAIDGTPLDLMVAINGTGSVTVTDVPWGEYTVTEIDNWSWRYTPDNKSVTLNLVNSTDKYEAVFVNTRDQIYWLDGDSYCRNYWGNLTPTPATQNTVQ